MNSRARLRTQVARWSEALASRYLKRKGLIIWKRNLRCHNGEIDILALSPRTLHIVEVKARRHGNHDYSLSDSVSEAKLKRISRATAWLMRKEAFTLKRMAILNVSFDFVGIEYLPRKLKGFKRVSLEYSPSALGESRIRCGPSHEL